VTGEGVSLDFGNLPLMEAAVRVAFQAPVSLSYQTIYGIHDHLKDQFPAVTEPSQIEIAPGVGMSPDQFGPSQLPGVVFEGAPNGLRVSVHPQVVVARWVRTFVANPPEYPRYGALKGALWRTIEATRKACRDAFSAILVTNMSYVNFVEVKNPATVMREYFSESAQLTAAKKATQIRKMEAAWAEDDIDVRFAVEQATAKIGGQSTDGYRLTTAGGRRLSEDTDAKSALDSVHEHLQHFFRDLISEQAKKEWGLKGT
jgi:uncharacterized protein (TIGR04255 family)